MSAETHLTSARILVVDDDPSVLQSVSWVLEEHGYDVIAAHGGEAFLEELERPDQPPPDLLLLDILMPDGDGVQLLERVKAEERWRDVPVLMLSSVPPEDATVRTLGLDESAPGTRMVLTLPVPVGALARQELAVAGF